MASSNAKLALFYDWLFFTPDKDNIMNIEPAILVMHHSMRPHPAITATLLDFLCRIIPNFLPRERDKVHQGITNSLKTILEKRVLPTLLPLFDNPRLDEELRTMLRERFPIFVNKEDPPILDREEDGDGGGSPASMEGIGKFSDSEEEEEEEEKQKVKKKSKRSSKQQTQRQNSRELSDDCKEILADIKTESDAAKKCEAVDNLLKLAIGEEFGFEQCSALASQLAEVLQEEFEGRVFPANDNKELIEDSVGRPIFVLFRSLCETADSDPNRGTLLQLLAELYTLHPRVGYYLLYFLKADRGVTRNAKEKASLYKDLCEAIDENFSLDICLVNDMRQCQEDDVSLFVYLVPDLFANFPKQAVGNTDLMYLVVSCVDGNQIQTLVCHVISRYGWKIYCFFLGPIYT